MNLENRINESRQRGERLLDAARRAPTGSTADSLVAGSQRGGLFERTRDFGQAAEQLRHNSGWVFACVRAIAQRIAGQPLRVGKIVDGMPPRRSREVESTIERGLPGRMKHLGPRIEPIIGHPVSDLLSDPNELMVGWSLVFTLVASLELTGRGFWWVAEHRGRRIVLPIPTSWIEGYSGRLNFESWHVKPPVATEPYLISSAEMVHVSYPDPADPRGALSPLQSLAAAVDADEAISTAQATMFRMGIHPRHALKAGRLPGTSGQQGVRPVLTGAQRKQLISTILGAYEGVLRRNEPLILDGMIEDVVRLSNTVEEMDFLKSSELTKARICQGFGVNPIVFGQVEGANRASAVVAEQAFCDNTLNPKIELISQCLTAWLGPIFAAEAERLVIWIEPCVPHDAEMSLKRADFLARHKLATTDELRELMGLGPCSWPLVGADPPGMSSGEATIASALAGFIASRPPIDASQYP